MWTREPALRRGVWPEAAIVAAFGLWMIVPLLTLLRARGVFNGAYGLDVADLMQYMAFIRDAGQHVLISNQFDVVNDPHLFFDPVFDLSGLLWRLGASIQLALLIWVPLAAASIAASFLAYVRSLLSGRRAAAAVALVLALFYLTPAVPLAQWLHGTPGFQFSTSVIGLEMFTAAYPWGGGPALALALMPLFLLAVSRLLEPELRAAGRSARWYGGWAAAAGGLTTWLHPWQGITLLVILAMITAWGRFDRRYRVLGIPAAVTAAPLAYFYALSRTHSSWMAAAHPNGSPHWGWWLVAALAPAVLALSGYFGRAPDLQHRILRAWPPAAFAVYLALDRTWFYHAFAGTSLPLAVLTVRGLGRAWSRRAPARARPALVGGVVALAVAAAIVPGLVWVVQQLVKTRQAHFFTSGEARALAFLDHSATPGPVLAAAVPLGEAVPGFTGRQSYDGHYYWTPDYNARTAAARALFSGRLTIVQATALIRASHATFLAAGCSQNVDLMPRLHPLLERSWRFGCASVYEVRSASRHAQTTPASTVRMWVQTR